MDCLVLEVTGSNLNQDTGYPDKYFCGFPQPFRTCAEIATSFHILPSSLFITIPSICSNIWTVKCLFIYQEEINGS